MLTRRGGRTFVGSLFWLVPSLIAWVLCLLLALFVLLTIAPVLPFRRFEQVQTLWGHRMVGWAVHLAFSRYRFHEDPRYDRGRTVVFVQNHVSMLDGFMACGIYRVPLCGLENAAHLDIPGYGWLMKASNAIPVESAKKGAGRFQRIAAAIRERASRGISILTFPEGHRTTDGKVRPFREGVFRMARDAGLPIVPVGVRGAFRMLPKGAITARPATLEVYIAPPIETEGLSDEQLPELVARAHAVVAAWVERGEKLGDLCEAPFEPVAVRAVP